MATTDENKLLEKVLSKWNEIDKSAFDNTSVECSKDENGECDDSEGYLCTYHQKRYREKIVKMIESEARADEREKMAERMKIIESQIPTVSQGMAEGLKHDADVQKAERQRCIREVMIVIIDLQEKIRYSKDSDFCCPKAKAHEFNGLVKAAKAIAKLSKKVD